MEKGSNSVQGAFGLLKEEIIQLVTLKIFKYLDVKWLNLGWDGWSWNKMRLGDLEGLSFGSALAD